MLSRLAGNCFWLARYLERTENTARLAGAVQTHSAMPGDALGDVGAWSAALAVATDPQAYADRFGEVAPRQAAVFLLLDRANLSSVVSCLRAVRENARTARHLFTDPYWDAINTTWLEAQKQELVGAEALEPFLEWALHRCQWIRGAAGDLLRDELPAVLAAGQALERIDYTARLLANWLPPLLATGEAAREPGSPGYRHWARLVGAAGASEMYRRLGLIPGAADDTARMLVGENRLPRSLARNAEVLEEALRNFTHGAPCPALVPVAALRKCLAAASADPLADDWRAMLGDVVVHLCSVVDAISRDHFDPSAPADAALAPDGDLQ